MVVQDLAFLNAAPCLKRNTRAALDGRLAQSRGAQGMAIDKKLKVGDALGGDGGAHHFDPRPRPVDLARSQGPREVQAMASAKSNRWWLEATN